ncbi:MAG: glycosyltransferase [Bacteroides sp.]|nr:glycosyltransferase [Prevotella sp.]MCM1407849.1 glycosyltransferase [Treponema brennaborense]MCM1469591.1 glycosyltransferase [Bacteroides sp.]
MKVAIVHDWLVNYGGAERVVQVLLELYPQADIYTLAYDKKKMARFFPPEKVHPSKLQRIPFISKLYTKLLVLMPSAFEEFDLSAYDLVISSSSSCAKGVITPPQTLHIAYIHTPMRYAWDLYFDYKKRSGKLVRFFMERQIPRLRLWDYVSSQRVDLFIANSRYIKRRIEKFWNRQAQVIYPPVTTEHLSPSMNPPENFYVAFSRLVPYKRIDLAVSACKRLGRNLVVIGGGSQMKQLRALARTSDADSNTQKKPSITFTGRISDEEAASYLQRCRALIFCAEEDFGIIPLEAQACGRPVIAFGKGGALETVVNEKTGVFFPEQTAESVTEAIARFEKLEQSGIFDPQKIAEHARRFSAERFKSEFSAAVEKTAAALRNACLPQ